MRDELGLILSGDSGRMHEKIEIIGLMFHANRRASIEEARALQLTAMERLAQAVNDHEKIQPYLLKRPLTFRDVEIDITFAGINGKCSDGTVGHILNVIASGPPENANKLFYFSNDAFHEESNEFLCESCDEALKIVQNSPIENLAIHKASKKEEEIDQALHNYLIAAGNKLRLYPFAIGGKWADGIEELAASFRFYKFATKEESRQLVVDAVQELLSAINNNEQLRPYIKEFPFPANRVKIHIEFVDRESPHYRGVEKLDFENNEITYYHRVFRHNDVESNFRITDSRVLAQEPYPEAVSLVEKNPVSSDLSIFERIAAYFYLFINKLFTWILS